MEAARQKQEAAKLALLAATSTPQHHHVEENENCDENDELINGHVSRDLQIDSSIVDPVEERRTLAERNERLHDQLKVRCSVGESFSKTRRFFINVLIFDIFTDAETRFSSIARRN